jgi:peptidoglycan/xylan/chitin deacetylase (PgdA/CDA1 family)
MRVYRFPKLFRFLYPGAIWEFSSPDIYLTFDDGPDPETTPAILEILEKENIKATFFCIGKQVKKHPDIYQTIIEAGHTVGNHSMTHLNGFWTSNKTYLQDVLEAKKHISSKLFRPPYGRIRLSQYRKLKSMGFKTVFWSIVSYDFDQPLPGNQYVAKMIDYAKPGLVYVFHDNPKSRQTTANHLPLIIAGMKKKGYGFRAIEQELFS